LLTILNLLLGYLNYLTREQGSVDSHQCVVNMSFLEKVGRYSY